MITLIVYAHPDNFIGEEFGQLIRIETSSIKDIRPATEIERFEHPGTSSVVELGDKERKFRPVFCLNDPNALKEEKRLEEVLHRSVYVGPSAYLPA